MSIHRSKDEGSPPPMPQSSATLVARSSHRRGLTALVFLASLVVLAACSADETSSEPEAEAEGEEVDEQSTDESEGVDDTEEAAESEEAGEQISLRYNSYLGDATTAVQEALAWQERVVEQVAAETNHTIEFENFLGGSLGGGPESLAILQDGRADLGLIAPAFHPGDLPLTQVSTIPFLTDSVMGAMRANADLSLNDPDYSGEWQGAGVIPVMWIAAGNGAAGFTDPVASIDELEGLRLRVIGRHAEALAAVGVDPVAMDTAEIYESIDRGVLDGFGTLPFVTGLTGLALVEVAPHVTDLGLGQYTAAVGAAIRADVWDELPQEVRDIMLEAAEWVYDEFIPGNLEPQDEATCTSITEAGGSIQRLPQDEIDAWRDEVFDTIVDGWVSAAVEAGTSEDAARSFFDTYQASVAEQAELAEYEDGLQTCLAAPE
jgi:TRAP-type transport system periplasmic protein